MLMTLAMACDKFVAAHLVNRMWGLLRAGIVAVQSFNKIYPWNTSGSIACNLGFLIEYPPQLLTGAAPKAA